MPSSHGGSHRFESYSAHHLFNSLRTVIGSPPYFSIVKDAWSVRRSDSEDCFQHSAKLQSIPRRETEPLFSPTELSLPEVSKHRPDLQVPLPGDRISSLRKDEHANSQQVLKAQGLMFSDCPRKWLLNNSVCQSWAETASRLDAYK